MLTKSKRTFKEFVEDANDTSGVLALQAFIKAYPTIAKVVLKHDWYLNKIYAPWVGEAVFKMRDAGSIKKVTSTVDGKTSVDFDVTMRPHPKVIDAHLFKWDGSSRGSNGQKLWEYIKSFNPD